MQMGSLVNQVGTQWRHWKYLLQVQVLADLPANYEIGLTSFSQTPCLSLEHPGDAAKHW
jgi:hypothetical protein